MKKSLLVTTGATLVISAAVISSGAVFAMGQNGNGAGVGYTQQIQSKATVLNMTTDQLREQLKTKTLYQIAEEKNVSIDTLHEQLQSQARERWQDRGLTDEQIQARADAMADRQADCDGDGNGAGTGTGSQNGMRHGQLENE